MEEKISKYLKYLPLLYAFLITIGFHGINRYYSQFDIYIYNYISTSEILLSFLNIVTFFSVNLYLIAIFIVLVFPFIPKEKINFYYFLDKFKNKYPITHNFLLFGLFTILYSYFIIFNFLFENSKIDFYFNPFFNLFCYLLIFCWTIFMFLVSYLLKNVYKSRKALILSSIFFMSVILIYFIKFDTNEKVNLVLAGHPEYEVTFYVDTIVVQTNKNIVFIGSTNEFIFLRDLENNTNLIYPTKSIKKLEMHKNFIQRKSFINFIFEI